MEGVWVLLAGLVCISEAILVSNNGSGDLNNTGKSEQLIIQETQVKRSAFGGYYPDEYGYGLGNGYSHDHGAEYYPNHDHGADYHPQHHHHSYHHDPFKTLLVPLAGVALLGAAAIFASNPILLQLGVLRGKRRRRDLGEKQLQDLIMLEKFVSELPLAEVEQQNRMMLASYLSCSGGCVQRVACELHHHGSPQDIHVLDMVISEILNNEYIDDKIKKSVTKARKVGRSRGSCKEYPCQELDKMRNVVKHQKTQVH